MTCVPSDGGGALCSCYSNRSGYATFEIAEDPENDATCQLGYELCTVGIDVSGDGEKTCTTEPSVVDGNTCYANANCSTPALAGDADQVSRLVEEPPDLLARHHRHVADATCVPEPPAKRVARPSARLHRR